MPEIFNCLSLNVSDLSMKVKPRYFCKNLFSAIFIAIKYLPLDIVHFVKLCHIHSSPVSNLHWTVALYILCYCENIVINTLLNVLGIVFQCLSEEDMNAVDLKLT